MSPKTNTLVDRLIKTTSTILDEIQSKTVHNHKENDEQKEKGVKH